MAEMIDKDFDVGQKDLRALLSRVFSGPDGKKFDELLRRICYFDSDLFSSDTNTVMYGVGRRSVYVLLKKLRGGKTNE